jgi:SRSO17 transposase
VKFQRKAGKGYVLGVAPNHVFHSWGRQQPIAGTASAIAQSLPRKAWRRLPSGEGTKGPRWHDWAYLELADLDASEYKGDLAGEWTRGLLIRRNIADGSLAFFSTWCPKVTSIQKLVSVEGHGWAIEDSFEASIIMRPAPAWLAPPCLLRHARLRHDGCHPPSGQCWAST